MSEACTHDCSNCHADCSSRAPQHEPPHAKSHIKKVIGVVSGKGGVGKSMTSAMMAVSMRRKGYKVGVLDADITGPSIPKLFGVHGPAMGTEDGINPVESHTGIKIMSINLLLEDEEAPVVWRGPVIAGAVKQFWQEVIWDDVDFLFVDMPPGTGDVPLTDETGKKYHLPVLAKMPLNPEFAKEADAGMIETFAGDYLDGAADAVAKLLK